PADTPAPRQDKPAPPKKVPRLAAEATILDLDISLGIEDPVALARATLTLSGFPVGVRATKGRMLKDPPGETGVWQVSAADAIGLGLIVPPATADFDLTVSADFGDGDPQSAVLRIETGAAVSPPPDSEAQMTFRFAAMGAGAHRLKIHVDGRLTYDRELSWQPGDALYRDISIGYDDEIGLPFEIVIRGTVLAPENAPPPAFVGLLIDGLEIKPGSAAVTASQSSRVLPQGLVWTGDLIVDVRKVFNDVQKAPLTKVAAAAVPPAPTPKPSAPKTPEVHGDATPEAAGPDTAPDGDGPAEAANDILVIDATATELRRPAFLTEIRQLRDFIRCHGSEADGDVYARLGIDVGKWRDLVVHGPAGRPVDLTPMFPNLAPPGGIENAYTSLQIGIPSDIPPDDAIVISGLPAGALLKTGRNLGAGVWRLDAGRKRVELFLPANGSRVRSIEVASADRQIQSSVLVDTRPGTAILTSAPSPRMSPLPLSGDIFDPDDIGRLSLTISDMPAGVLLSQGTNHGDGVWTIETAPSRLPSIIVAALMPSFSIAVTCVAVNKSTGASNVVTRRIKVPAQGVAILQPLAA
ncbi:MAG: hypothetical protein O2944_09640, partial [Proteobacteria bacterium]|nr:hypothetical protein [Pseudomonadota bacterium]